MSKSESVRITTESQSPDPVLVALDERIAKVSAARGLLTNELATLTRARQTANGATETPAPAAPAKTGRAPMSAARRKQLSVLMKKRQASMQAAKAKAKGTGTAKKSHKKQPAKAMSAGG